MPHVYAMTASLLLLLSMSASSAGAQEPFTIAEVAFLSGCWTGRTGELELREQWTDPAGGLMLGATRFIRGGTVVDWEFGRLIADSAGVTLWPYPSGSASAAGFPLVRAGDRLVFENLAHDFPVRILYLREGAEALRVRIEGPDGSGREWGLTRAACPSGG